MTTQLSKMANSGPAVFFSVPFQNGDIVTGTISGLFFVLGGRGLQVISTFKSDQLSIRNPAKSDSFPLKVLPPKRPPGSTDLKQIRSNSPRIPRMNNQKYFSSAQRRSGNPVHPHISDTSQVEMRQQHVAPFSIVFYAGQPTKATLNDKV